MEFLSHSAPSALVLLRIETTPPKSGAHPANQALSHR